MARAYYGPGLQRVFLMDGDAIIIKTEDLLRILRKLYDAFPALEEVDLYAGPRSTLSKTPEELKALHDAGLSRAYLGVESGSDAVLKFIHKGVDAQQMLQAGQRLVEAGIDLWVTIILGITGEGGDWAGARPVHRPDHQPDEAPAPVRHDLRPRQGHPPGGRRAGRPLQGLLAPTTFWRSAACSSSIWTWTRCTSPATTPLTICP